MVKNLKAKVEYCLQTLPESRNSDITLMIEIWRRYYSQRVLTFSHLHGDFINTVSLYHLPRQDSIKRIRAHFQNVEKKYLPTDWKVAKQRKINESEWKEYMLELSSYKRL